MNLPIRFLDYGGLYTLVQNIKRLFATKDELAAFGSSQTILAQIDAAVDQRISYRIANGDISRIQASITDDVAGNLTIVFDSTDSTIQNYVESKIDQSIQNGDIARLQASITDNDNGDITINFETTSS